MAPLRPALRMRSTAAQGRLAPVAASRAPIPYAVAPLSTVKDPATISRDASGLVTMSQTNPSPDAVGAHDVSVPVVALHAASSVRGWPLLERKFPPAYTVSPMNEKARTCPSVRGAHGVSAPVATSKAATCARAWPSTVVKSPPK